MLTKIITRHNAYQVARNQLRSVSARQRTSMMDEMRAVSGDLTNPEMQRVSFGKAFKEFDKQILGHIKQVRKDN